MGTDTRMWEDDTPSDKERIKALEERMEELEYYVNDFTNICFRIAKQFAEDINI